MSQNLCPSCAAPLLPADLNMAEGVGLCRGCGKLSRLSDIALAAEEPASSEALAETPPGCVIIDDTGGSMTTGRVVVRASLRSFAGAIGLGVFALFWNGIVSIFVTVVITGWYTKLIGPLPAWVPSPSVSQNNGPSQTGPQMATSELIFMTLFMTPFVLVGAGVLFATLACLFGSVRVIIQGERGRVRTGIGPLSFGKTFDALNVKSVAIGASTMKQNNRQQPQIVIEADRPVRFGTGLPKERRAWMVAALRKLLVESRSTR
jgi:hypothetical protein